MNMVIEIIILKFIQMIGIVCAILLPIYIGIWILETIEKIIVMLKHNQ